MLAVGLLKIPQVCVKIFKGFGVITIGQITWMSFVMVLLHVVLTAGCFIAGYFLKASALRRRASEIVNEIRSVG